VYSHLAARYGEFQQRPARETGLSARQERVAKEMLVSDLSREPGIVDIAQACGLSASRFVRAFRQTTGAPPFRWLRTFRVERAKDLLLNSALSLSQITYECGFA